MRQLVLHIARGLVREPGRVIGREGRTAHALRVLVEALARRRGDRVELEILD